MTPYGRMDNCNKIIMGIVNDTVRKTEIQNMILSASCLINNLFIYFSFFHSFIPGGSVVRVLGY